MPGKTNLQQFSSDVLNIGDEVKVRAARGEKPSIYEIPPDISDTDDSQDFVIGMPEPEELEEDKTQDLSEAKAETSEDQEEEGAFVPDIPLPGEDIVAGPSDIPDLDAILNGVVSSGNAAGKQSDSADIDLDQLLDSVTGGSRGKDPTSDNLKAQDSAAQSVPEEKESQTSPVQDTSFSDFGLDNIPDLENISDEDLVPAEKDASDDAQIGGKTEADASPAGGETAVGGGEGDPFADDDFDGTDSAIDLTGDISEESKEIPDDYTASWAYDVPPENAAAGADEKNKESGSDSDLEETGTSAPGASAAQAEDDYGLPEMETEQTFGGQKTPLESAEQVSGGSAQTASVSDDFSPHKDAQDTFGADDFSFDKDSASPSGDVFGGDFGLDDIDTDAKASIPSIDETAVDDNIDLSALDDIDLPATDSADFSGEASFDDESDFDKEDSEGGGAGDELESGSKPETGSGLDGLNIEETDARMGSPGDDFGSMDDEDFSIPGFSDIDEAALDRTVSSKIFPASEDDSETSDTGSAQENSLTEDEYERFKKNLSGYPLNVKLAVEELIVSEEFKDDVIFEVIERVLKKQSARQLASHLEKMLDISLPVPRNFERRTVAEYEAYKASFEYQLKNKIIPLGLICVALGLIGIFLFFTVKQFVYNPLKAVSLYRQGYELLESEEYPQSEQKFKEAVTYKENKKWFYRYAGAYRAHKQYERARVMYDDILKRFNNDKPAGLEYADMEWRDLADYESAVRILNDRVLLYHVNDPDALLLLGDIYLDWGDNGEPENYEKARINYASLMNLYGAKDLYLSRMLRYFIRTDNLREVLQLKDVFFPKKKSLGAQDLTELSGYMFDKIQGGLTPAEEYLRDKIEDVKALMERAIQADPNNPTALYNMARYYLNMANHSAGLKFLDAAIEAFKNVPKTTKADAYRRIDSYRLKGEIYVKQNEIIKAVETYTEGISLYKTQSQALPGNYIIGKLYSDMADIDYFKFNNTDAAYEYYRAALENENDTPSIRYRIGAILYEKNRFPEALGAFIAVAELVPDDNNLLMALGNVLSERNSYNAAKGYYEELLSHLDVLRANRGILLPQVEADDADIVELYMKASNNLGVILYHLARRTGNSNLNARSIVYFSESLRAWDALTRNQVTMTRLPGTNLAEENIRYILKPVSDFEPAVYPDIPRTLSGEKGID
ncbi:periplasmic flagellar collar protein FlcA [Treponema parvum]|uniref:periplasmic flagellar collar protein FlcA n=1 Tax=Treponema parvum TaxID=138851 RepID=UPI001AEBBF23|nr:tetratricopeptide repeat protein [Treponema parvum]QTQ15730.1 tetratricopeptide repeat protein [Treponema parvum]